MTRDDDLIRSGQRTDSDRPNGPAVAAMAAAGIGCAALGVFTMLYESMPDRLKWAFNLCDPVGPLTGKTVYAVAVYVIAWVVLGVALRGKEVALGKWLFLIFVLVVVGLVLTFPPVFLM